MGRAHPIKTNFTSGEISPLMKGRIDVNRYHSGVEVLENFIPLVQGGVNRRTGTQFIEATKDSATKKSRLIPFVASDSEKYLLEFSDQAVRIYEHDVKHPATMRRLPLKMTGGGGGTNIRLFVPDHRLQTNDVIHITGTTGVGLLNNDVNLGTGNPVNWVITRVNDDEFTLNGSTGVGAASGWNGDGEFHLSQQASYVAGVGTLAGVFQVTSQAVHDLEIGDKVELRGITGTTPALPDGIYTVISIIGGNSFQVDNVEQGTPITSIVGWNEDGVIGGLTPACVHSTIEIDTPYLEADLDELSFTQSADILYIAHNEYPPLELQRLHDTAWALVHHNYTDGPYMPRKYSDTKDEIICSEVTNDITIFAPTTGEFTIGTPSVGDYVEWRHHNEWRVGLINTVLATDAVVVDVDPNIVTGFDPEVRLKAREKIVKSFAAVAGQETTRTYERVGFLAKKTPNSPADPAESPYVMLYKPSTNIKSTHAGVFKRAHIGKKIRIEGVGVSSPWAAQKEVWYDVTQYGDDTTVNGTIVSPFHNTTNHPLRELSDVTVWTGSTHRIIIDVDADQNQFVSTDVDRWITFYFGDARVFGKIETYIHARKVKVRLHPDYPLPRDPKDSESIYNGGIPDSWRLGAWSETTGYPGVVAFHEQRIVWARTPEETQTLWFSKIDDYPNHAPSDVDSTVTDESAMTYTIASGRIDSINWLSSGQVLLIGTESSEFQARAASSIQEPITPTNISITPQSGYGSKQYALPIQVGAAVIFVQKAGRKIREMTYSFEIDKHVSRDISVISEHIPRRLNSSIKQVTYQQEPHQTYWMIHEDGQCSIMTYEKDQDVIAWARMIFGGNFGGANPVIESITSLPGDKQDYVYVIIKRTINGGTVRYIEKITEDFFPEGSVDEGDQWFLDGAIKQVTAGLTQTITGLNHLEGESVYTVSSNGSAWSYTGPDTVAGGQITVSTVGTQHITGLLYSSTTKPMPFEAGGLVGTGQGKIKRFNRLDLRIWKGLEYEHGSDLSAMTARLLGTVASGGPLLSLDDSVLLQQGYDRQAQFYLRVVKPFAFTLLAIMPEGVTYEEQ